MSSDAASPTQPTAPIDPQLAAVLAAVPLQDVGGAVTDVALLREGMETMAATVPVTTEVADVHDVDADGVGVRVYRPAADGPLPLVLLVHGGGFVLGSPATHDGLARRLAAGADVVVVSVDYRLAPEAPFPAALDDCWTALRWAVAHADELGADPARVAVAGDSAGGNLAAVLALEARDAGGPALVFQLLLYPVTSGHHDWPSIRENADAPVLTARAMAWFAEQYAADGSVRSAPALAESFAGLPPARVVTAGHDPLRDDGEAYAALLTRDGVTVDAVRHADLVHGFTMFDGVVPACTTALDSAVAALRAGVHS